MTTLQTKTAITDSTLSSLARDAANYLANAIRLFDSRSPVLLVQNDEDLTKWLNSRQLADTLELFTVHEKTGDAANALAALIAPTAGVTLPSVDVRSVADKLAAAGRTLTVTEAGLFQVSTIQPPEPPNDLPA